MNIYIILISQDYHHYLKCSLKYILKYDTVGNIYKLLGKCSFKYFDEYLYYFNFARLSSLFKMFTEIYFKV